MKRYSLIFVFCFIGMTVFAQGTDMSFYTSEYTRSGSSFNQRLTVLETVRDAGLTGIGEFYHEALKFLLLRIPDIRNITDHDAAEKSAVILCQGLGAERYTAAAPELWQVVEFFDVAKNDNEGHAMSAALNALGQVGGRDFLPQIVLRLNNFNTLSITNAEARRRVQVAAIGCINALEAFQDAAGFRPIFFASIGSYDARTREVASRALPNIAEDPGEVIAEIIRDPSSDPSVKLAAWREMLRTRASDSSKARVAAVALATGWNYSTANISFQTNLREMRKSAIDSIRQFGAVDASVYENLERSYSSNFLSNTPDYDEIVVTLNALTALRTDEAIELLLKFLRDLHSRRSTGPWRQKERQVFEWVISCIGVTRTQSVEARILLTNIQRTDIYTPQERNWARNALIRISN